MADLLDQVHAQQSKPSGGDLLDQVHARTQTQDDSLWTGIKQGVTGLVTGVRDMGNSMLDSLESPLGKYLGPPGAAVDMTYKVLHGIHDAAADQFAKVAPDFHKGSYMTGVRHALAGVVPLLGPEVLGEQGDLAASGQPLTASGRALVTGASLVAPEVVPKVLSKVQGTIGPLIKTTLNPVEQASQTFLEGEGVDTPVSMQTGSRLASNLQGMVRNEPGGSGFAQEAIDRTRAQVEALAQRKLADISPNPATSIDAGEAVLGKIKRDIKQLDLKADQNYTQAWRVEADPANARQIPVEREVNGRWQPVLDDEGNPTYESMQLPVEMTHIQEQLRPLAERYARTLSDTDARASLGLKTMREMINGPTYKPASQLEMDLGLLKKAARSEKGLAELRTGSQGLAANSVRLVQQAVDDAVSGANGGQQALGNLQAARGATQQKWSIYDQARKFGNPNLEELEPASVYTKLTAGKDTRIQFLRRIQAMTPAEMPEVGRAFVENLFDRVTREGGIGHVDEVLNQWDNLGRESKLVLLGNPDLVDDWDNLFVSLKRLAKEPNPSGSGYLTKLGLMKNAVSSGLGMVVSGLTGHGVGVGAGAGLLVGQGLDMLSNAALSRMLYDQRFTRLLTKGIQYQLSGQAGAAALTGAQLMQMAKPVVDQERQDNRPPLSSFHQ